MTAPALPYSRIEFLGGEKDETKVPGLTKREYAAIHIAAAIASRRTVYTEEDGVAQLAVALADAVLREAGE